MNSLEERFPQLWGAADRAAVVVLTGLLFCLFSLPIITIPAALAASFGAVAPLFTPAAGDTITRFWRTFRRSFVTALWLGLLDLVVGAVLYFDIAIVWRIGATWSKVAAFGFGSLGVLAAMVNLFAWPLLAWFPQPLGKLLRRAFLLAAAHPFLAIGGLLAGLVGLLVWLLLPGVLLGLLPLLGPGLAATAAGFAAWQAMKRYTGTDDPFAE